MTTLHFTKDDKIADELYDDVERYEKKKISLREKILKSKGQQRKYYMIKFRHYNRYVNFLNREIKKITAQFSNIC